jgi:hypothetical protein
MQAMEGKSDNWVQTPNGPENQPVQNTPGHFFRSILAGAVAGAAGGAETPYFGKGMARGAGAGMKEQQAQHQRDQQQAQQQFENQQKVNEADQRKIQIDATVANMHSETIARQHQTDILDKTYHDNHNAASAAMVNSLKQAGGVAPVDGAVPEEISAPELRDAIIKDRNVQRAPEGYVRHFFDRTDSTEVTWDEKNQNWVTPDGTSANMTDKTTLDVLDVPRDAMTTKKPVSGADLNKIYGQKMFDEKGSDGKPKMYQVSPWDLDSANTNRLKNENETARTAASTRTAQLESNRQAQEAEKQRLDRFESYRQAVTETNTNLNKQASEEMDPTKRDAIRQQIAANDAGFKSRQDEIFGTKTGKKSETAPPPPPPPPDTNTVSGLQSTVVGYAPEALKGATNVYLKGGPIGNIQVPAPTSYPDFVSNLSSTQGQVPEQNKLSPQDYQRVLDLGKTYFDNLPKLQQKFSGEGAEKKMANARSRNPGMTIKPTDLDYFTDDGRVRPGKLSLIGRR